MVAVVDVEEIAEAGRALGQCSYDVGEHVHLLNRTLPAGCPAALIADGNELWVVFDNDQPCDKRHAWALLQDTDLVIPAEEAANIVALLPSPRLPLPLHVDHDRRWHVRQAT